MRKLIPDVTEELFQHFPHDHRFFLHAPSTRVKYVSVRKNLFPFSCHCRHNFSSPFAHLLFALIFVTYGKQKALKEEESGEIQVVFWPLERQTYTYTLWEC